MISLALRLLLALSIVPNPIGQTPLYTKESVHANAGSTSSEEDANLANNYVLQGPATKSKTEVQEIRFSFHPRFYTEFPIDLFVALQGNGEAQALRYDDPRRLITAAYKGTLPKADARRLAARVQEAFREYRNAAPRDEKIITEGNLFYLSIKLKDGEFEQIGGKVADMPELMGKLVGELSVLWKRLKKTAPAPGYLRSFTMDKERFESLQSKGLIRFATLEEFPSDIHPIIIDAINNSPSFQAINRAQLEKLRAQKNMALNHNGSGYELYLFSSQR